VSDALPWFPKCFAVSVVTHPPIPSLSGFCNKWHTSLRQGKLLCFAGCLAIQVSPARGLWRNYWGGSLARKSSTRTQRTSWIYSSRCFLALRRRTQNRKLGAETALSDMAIHLQLHYKIWNISYTISDWPHSAITWTSAARLSGTSKSVHGVGQPSLTFLGAMPILWRTTYISWHWGSYEYCCLTMEIAHVYQTGRVTLQKTVVFALYFILIAACATSLRMRASACLTFWHSWRTYGLPVLFNWKISMQTYLYKSLRPSYTIRIV
jgi:hypothetical protein